MSFWKNKIHVGWNSQTQFQVKIKDKHLLRVDVLQTEKKTSLKKRNCFKAFYNSRKLGMPSKFQTFHVVNLPQAPAM